MSSNKTKLSGAQNKKRRIEKDNTVRQSTQDISKFLFKGKCVCLIRSHFINIV